MRLGSPPPRMSPGPHTRRGPRPHMSAMALGCSSPAHPWTEPGVHWVYVSLFWFVLCFLSSDHLFALLKQVRPAAKGGVPHRLPRTKVLSTRLTARQQSYSSRHCAAWSVSRAWTVRSMPPPHGDAITHSRPDYGLTNSVRSGGGPIHCRCKGHSTRALSH